MSKPTFPLDVDNSADNKKSILAANSMTKKKKNQDALIVSIENNIIAIADGVGSHLYSEKGSAFVVEKIVELINENEDFNNIDFSEIFIKTHKLLNEYIKVNFKDEISKIENQGSFGTTLIVAIDLPDKYIVAYIGNGCIWHMRGNYSDLTKNIYLPWHSINILNPHTIQVDGKEALYKIFSYGEDTSVVKPSIVEISKDNELFGDILMIGTDGIFSNDQTIPGKDGDDKIWIPSSEIMEKFYNHLGEYLKSEISHDNDNAKSMLHNFLSEVKHSENLMDDDTTLGLIISQPCLNYIKKKYKKS